MRLSPRRGKYPGGPVQKSETGGLGRACEKPDSFHGFEEFDFYQLPELRLSLTPADTVQVAAW